MKREFKTPKAMYGFIENLNLVAEHIRNVDKSIYDDIAESIELARAWAISQTEPDPINYPGEQSSKTSANQAQVSAANALASEQAAAISQTESHKSEMIATAEALTSTSYAIEPQGSYVKEYYYDEANDSIEFNELIGTYSALHYAIEASQFDPNDFYLKTDHINTSNGTNDAGKPIVLNQNGQIDSSMLDTSTFYPVAAHDPSDGTEYPDTTGQTHGAFWWVETLANPTGTDPVKGDYYEFTTDPAASIEDSEIASLLGKQIFIGDFMVWAATGWGIMAGEMNPTLYYKLDGSHALTGPFAGGGQQIKNIADGSDSTDACTMQQLSEKSDITYVDNNFSSKGFEGRAKTWDDIGLDDADFAGLDVVGALQYISSVMEEGQEVEEYMNDSSANPNFASIFPESDTKHVKIIKIRNTMIRFEYTSYKSKLKGYRTFYNWDNSLEDSGYVELMNKEDGLLKSEEAYVHGLLYKGEIGDGEDLNDYNISGLYDQDSNSAASSGENYPTAKAGLLRVAFVGSNKTYQRYEVFGNDIDNTNNETYERRKYGSDRWSAWTRVINSAGGTLDGQLKGITPVDDEDLTRKDYVDGLVAPLIARIEQLEAKIAQLEGESNE